MGLIMYLELHIYFYIQHFNISSLLIAWYIFIITYKVHTKHSRGTGMERLVLPGDLKYVNTRFVT